jgi:hypothetical protein
MRKIPGPILIFLLFAHVAGLYGCSNDSQQSESLSAKTAVKSLRFVESSASLPITGQWRHGLGFYDINRDGNLDILAPPPRDASKPDRRPYVWLGNGKGEWVAAPPRVPSNTNIPYDYGDIAAGDFNGDHIPDMALAMHTRGLWGLKGDGSGTYTEFQEGLTAYFDSRALVAADFNNDGIQDIAAVAEADFKSRPGPPGLGIKVCLGSATGWQCRFVEGPESVNWLFADKIITGDVNGDGNPDLGIASLQHRADLIVWLGDGNGGFKPFNNGLPKELHYPSVAFADVNGDGRDDLIASITGFGKDGVELLKVFLSRKNGLEDRSQGLPEDQVFTAVGAGDLDGDGVPEIVSSTPTGQISVFCLKDREWKKATISGLSDAHTGEIFNIYCVDVNKDGLDDIVFNHYSENVGGGIRVFLTVPQHNQ